ncbi:MAG: deoxyribodipyrimidine photo-lyase [Hyphomicrobium sp.]
MIEPERIQYLNGKADRTGRYVLYWMQQSQRTTFNPALSLAILEANARDQALVVGFGLTDTYPEANARHYAFMLQGLVEVRNRLQERGIAFVIRRGEPSAVALALAEPASLVVCDRGYLRHQKQWRETVATRAACPVVQVEGDVVVPVDLVSGKSEHAARTIRPKIHRHRDRFLAAWPEVPANRAASSLHLDSDIDIANGPRMLDGLDIDRSVKAVRRFAGGGGEARRRLADFIDDRFEGYARGRNEPADWRCSFLSPYLHFGQISPVEIALEIRQSKIGAQEDRAAYLEELIVRRELAMNYVNFTPNYDAYSSVPAWARQSLAAHRDDPRKHIYTQAQLEAAETHDPYWNAAMREMTCTGFMHNYMRMYWAKKIIEWTATPEQAFQITLNLNNKYFIDGRGGNAYANVAWCFGLHDRGWTERAIFGKVRSMSADGLKRKFDIERYVAAVEDLVAIETA